MRYMLICTNCGQKHFTDGNDIASLVQVNSAPLPRRADGKNKTALDLPKRFKCYNCGHLFKIVRTEEKKETKPEPEMPPLKEDNDYLKEWENEILKSMRKPTPRQ